MSIPFQDFRSLVQEAFNVEGVFARGLWTEAPSSLSNSKTSREG